MSNPMPKNIQKILIANRGEIACRVMATAQEMGIKTVAVYSDADAGAMHTQMADEAVHIGASPAAESYLVQQKIIDACLQTGADAVHPGYGFLSENPDFANLCAENDIIFIGPSADSMNAMALKGKAKQLMIDAGVPVVPGYHGDAQDDDSLYQAAVEIGFPVLIKAVAGGGGKGMRAVHTESELIDAIRAARSEGEKSFSNGKLLIEKLIQKPRHIELQVFGDQYGNAVHLLERDCSIQRRHQKVIEEAPAPGMSDAMREKMGDAAVNAAKAVNYSGAGTVEFIVDVTDGLDDAPFYFMEMNTRLQVEHPVTEMITGVDLVEWQIRIAEGHEIPVTQDDILNEAMGHSIEVRLYAEDPANNYLPAIGTLDSFEVGAAAQDGFVRVETGVRSGDEISIFYDPMIAKLVVYGDDREQAIHKMQAVLKDTLVAGTKTNRDFLARLVADQDFIDANLDTGFLSGKDESLCQNPALSDTDYILAALTDHHESHPSDASRENTPTDPWDRADAFRVNRDACYHYAYTDSEGERVAVSLTVLDPNNPAAGFSAKCGDTVLSPCHVQKIDDGLRFSLGHGDNSQHLSCLYAKTSAGITIAKDTDSAFIPAYLPDFDADNVVGGDGAVLSPMPGKILDIKVANGDSVKAGDALIIMEAMKMEQTLKAPKDGIIQGLSIQKDDQVSDNTVLLEVADPEQ